MRIHWLAVLVLLAGAGVAAAQPGGPGPRGPRDGDMRQHLEEAGLSAEQIERLKTIHSDEHKASIRARAELKVARLELRELLDAATVDQAAVASRVKRIGELQAALLKSRVDARLAARAVMTPEQHEKLKQLRPPRPERTGPPRGPRHGHGEDDEDGDEDE
jgi:Spy/CpxP family protein refolding chaperone